MSIETVDEANSVAREWLSREYGVDRVSIKSISCVKTENLWRVVMSFYSFTEAKKYSVVISDDGRILRTQELGVPTGTSSMGSAPTLTLIAFIFSILAEIGFAVYFIVILVIAIFPFGFFATFLVFIPLALVVIGLWVLSQVVEIRRNIEAGNARAAYDQDSVLLGVMALIFNGVITGILLLIARDDLRRAADSQLERTA